MQFLFLACLLSILLFSNAFPVQSDETDVELVKRDPKFKLKVPSLRRAGGLAADVATETATGVASNAVAQQPKEQPKE